MSPFVRHVLVGLGSVVVAVLLTLWGASIHQAECNEHNYRVYSFEKCMTDDEARCFVSPADVVQYSKSLTWMHQSRYCRRWFDKGE